MRAQKSGKIVNIASMTVNDGTPAGSSTTWPLRRPSGDSPVHWHESWVTTASRSNTLTPDYIPHDADYAAKQPHVDGLIIGRRAFKRSQVPDDMVGTLLYLVSPWSDFVTGQNIWVNGGSGFH